MFVILVKPFSDAVGDAVFGDCSLRVIPCLLLVKNNTFEMINTLYQYFCALAVLESEIKYKSER